MLQLIEDLPMCSKIVKAYAAKISLFLHKNVSRRPVAADNKFQPTLLAETRSIFMHVEPAQLFKQQVTLMKNAYNN
jgi:hypothetical protein